MPQIWAASPSWKAWLCALLRTALRRRQELPGHRWSESQGPRDKAARIIPAVLPFTEIPNLHICSWEDPDRFRWICEGLLPRIGFKFRLWLIAYVYVCLCQSENTLWPNVAIEDLSTSINPVQHLNLCRSPVHSASTISELTWGVGILTLWSPRRPFNFKSCTAQHQNFVANSSRKSKTAPLRLPRKTTVFLSLSALKSLMPHPSQPVSAGSELFFGTFCFNFLHNRWQQNEPLRMRKEHIVGTTGIFSCPLHSPDNYWGSYFKYMMSWICAFWSRHVGAAAECHSRVLLAWCCCRFGAGLLVLLEGAPVRVACGVRAEWRVRFGAGRLVTAAPVRVACALWSWPAGAAAVCCFRVPAVCILRNLGAATGYCCQKAVCAMNLGCRCRCREWLRGVYGSVGVRPWWRLCVYALAKKASAWLLPFFLLSEAYAGAILSNHIQPYPTRCALSSAVFGTNCCARLHLDVCRWQNTDGFLEGSKGLLSTRNSGREIPILKSSNAKRHPRINRWKSIFACLRCYSRRVQKQNSNHMLQFATEGCPTPR